MPVYDNHAAARKLKTMRTLAGALLILATALFCLGKYHHDRGGWAWLTAFAEAAMIGALADWFAVVALFRRPMGLPIPHTAILPRNKERLADALSVFVRDKFLDTHSLVTRVSALDPASAIARWLADPAHAADAANKLAAGAGVFVRHYDDATLRAALFGLLQRQGAGIDARGPVAALLELFTADRQHQALLDAGLRRIAAWLDSPAVQQQFADKIVTVAGEEYPTLISALGLFGVKTEDVGVKLAGALVRGIHQWLQDIAGNPDHERRLAFDEAVHEFLDKLKNDIDFRLRIEDAKHRLLESPALAAQFDRLWDAIRTQLLTGLETPDSGLRSALGETLQGLAAALARESSWRDALNAQCAQIVAAIAPGLRATVTDHIAQTVRAWDDSVLVREVENSVGSDLQYIRINGTVVGGLAGLAIHAVVMLVAL